MLQTKETKNDLFRAGGGGGLGSSWFWGGGGGRKRVFWDSPLYEQSCSTPSYNPDYELLV